MSIHVDRQQLKDWNEAVEAVDEVAANTDTESSSKTFLDALARQVRNEPRSVVRLLAVV